MEYEKATRQAGGQVLRAGDPGEVTAEQRLAKQLFRRAPPQGLTLGKGGWSEEGPRGWPGVAASAPQSKPSIRPQCLCLTSLRPLPPVGLTQQLQAFSQTLRSYA